MRLGAGYQYKIKVTKKIYTFKDKVNKKTIYWNEKTYCIIHISTVEKLLLFYYIVLYKFIVLHQKSYFQKGSSTSSEKIRKMKKFKEILRIFYSMRLGAGYQYKIKS
jgi:predicted RNase H-related nuclease YkuK (DUF458 family)